MFEIPGMDFTITMINLWKKIGGRGRISPNKSNLKNQMDIPKLKNITDIISETESRSKKKT